MRSRTVVTLICVLLLWSIARANAQDRNPPAPSSDKPHPLAQEMFKAGAMTCASAAHQLASLVSTGKEISLLQVPQKDVDRNVIDATLLVPKEKGLALVSMTFAPNQASGCGASFRGVMYVDDPCPKAAEKTYAELKMQPLGNTGALLGIISPRAQVIFMPAGKGCVLVTDELVR